MTDATTDAPDAAGAPTPTKRRGGRPILIGAVLALLLGGGGFYAAWSGLLPDLPGRAPADGAAPVADVGFVPIDPLLINLAPSASGRHLRFGAQIEVASGREGAVARLMPRILDVLNGYLRAVAVQDLEDPAALIRLRAQMLRRIQVVVGEGLVRDLLVTEFVLN